VHVPLLCDELQASGFSVMASQVWRSSREAPADGPPTPSPWVSEHVERARQLQPFRVPRGLLSQRRPTTLRRLVQLARGARTGRLRLILAGDRSDQPVVHKLRQNPVERAGVQPDGAARPRAEPFQQLAAPGRLLREQQQQVLCGSERRRLMLIA
jgi:hypothetical protein